MKKIQTIFMSVIIIILSIAACAQNSVDESAPTSTATESPQPVDSNETENTESEMEVSIPEGEILFSSERGGDRDLYMMNADGSNQRVILDLPSVEGHGDFAPDGYRIVFFSTMDGDRELYTIDLRDEEITPVRLTDSKGDDHLPDWSPDGKYIVFESKRDRGSEIYIMNSDGSNQRRLTDDNYTNKQPKFSPDGSVIIYTSKISGVEHMAIIKMEDVLSSEGMPLSETVDIKNIGYIDFAPDGLSAAYHSRTGGNRNLYTINLETYTSTVVKECSGYTAWVPVYSPDGNWIAYNKERGFGSGDVYVTDITGSVEYQLTTDPSSDWGPDWRPETEKIICYDSNFDGDREIYTYSTTYETKTKLTDNTYDDGIPYYSPDGSEIVFFSDRDGDDEIYIMNSDGSNVRQLTDNEHEDRAAVFSNNGEFIAFSSNRDGDREIFIMNVDGTNQKQLTFNSERDFWPAISKDDKTLTYTTFGSTQDTYYIDIENWSTKDTFTPKLLRANCSRCEYSPDGKTLAYSTKHDYLWTIAVCDADGENERIITTSSSNEWIPTWVDGEYLVFSRERGYKAGIIMVSIITLEEQEILYANSQNWRPVCMPY